jgi:ATP-dependent RNA helicase DeaD
MSKGFQRYQLEDRVLEALTNIGFKKPTEVQEQVIPLILQRRNVVVEAATGTGKTAAYGLPLLSRIDYTKRSTQVLVLAPSRELALQVETALRSFTTHVKFRVASVYGGMSLAESEKKIKSSPHILVAVPGRLKDALRGGKLDFFWRDIKYLVIDEADKLLELGFQEILDNLVSHLRNMVQVALFSATISDDVEELIRERFAPLQVVRLSPQEALRNIFFHYIVVEQGQKQRYLAGVIQNQKIKQALIFTPNRDEVYEVANYLRSLGLKAEAYHGLLDQVERAAVMKRFKRKQVNFLVATDLAARGLDVEALPAVINYAFPEDIEVYIHRCGRTGRAGKKGAVYNLVASKAEEMTVQNFHTELGIALKGFIIQPIEKNAAKSVENKLMKVHFSRGKRDKIAAGDIVGFLVNGTGVEADKIGTIAVYDTYTLVDMPEWAYEIIEAAEDSKLKGKTVKATKYSLDDQKNRSEALRKSQIGVADKRKLEEKAARRVKDAAKKVPEMPLTRTGKGTVSTSKANAEGSTESKVIKSKPRPSKKELDKTGKGSPERKGAGKSPVSRAGTGKGAATTSARVGKSVDRSSGSASKSSGKPKTTAPNPTRRAAAKSGTLAKPLKPRVENTSRDMPQRKPKRGGKG